MKREELLKKIDLYIEGELSGKELEEFNRLVEKCPECREEIQKYRNLLKLTHAVARYKPAPPPNLHLKIMKKIEEERFREKSSPLLHFLVPALTLALILAIIAIPSFLNLTEESSVPASSHRENRNITLTENKDTLQNMQGLTSPSPAPDEASLKLASEEFNDFINTIQNQRKKLENKITYIYPITSSASWKKLAEYLRLSDEPVKIAIRPIIKNRNVDYVDLISHLDEVRNTNPYVEIEDASTSTRVAGNPGAGVVLQISVLK